MATYGPNAGFVPFTGFSPTLGTDAITPVLSGNVQFNGITQSDDVISTFLFKRGNRAVRKLLLTVLGVVPGSTATENFTRVTANSALTTPFANGGVVPIETVAQVNRVTTAADVTNLTAMVSRTVVVSFPADVSGNGGGGRLGY